MSDDRRGYNELARRLNAAQAALDRVRALCDVWVYLEDEARDEGTKGVITYIGASRALRAALDGPDE